MRQHTETKILPYSAEQLFDLVISIDKYPEFLPWCIGARINKRQKNEIHADVIVGYKMFREKFTSRVHYIRPDAIEVEYLKGPLRHLQNKWRFTQKKDGSCKVEFMVAFEFRSRLFEKLAEQFFHIAFERMVDAFEQRAADVYKENG